MKKTQRKKALETGTTPVKQKKAPKSQNSAIKVDLSAVQTTYLKKGHRWDLIENPVSLDGFSVENYIEPAKTIFISKMP